MRAKTVSVKQWPVSTVNPPKANNTVWTVSGIAGVVLVVAAILQLVSFSDFRDILSLSGVSGTGFWGAVIILAELWGAVGLFKVPLSFMFRRVSYGLAILVAGFWFVNNLQLVTSATGNSLSSSGFFGRFLNQTPGWWTVIEVSILLFGIVYSVGSLINSETSASKRRK